MVVTDDCMLMAVHPARQYETRNRKRVQGCRSNEHPRGNEKPGTIPDTKGFHAVLH